MTRPALAFFIWFLDKIIFWLKNWVFNIIQMIHKLPWYNCTGWLGKRHQVTHYCPETDGELPPWQNNDNNSKNLAIFVGSEFTEKHTFSKEQGNSMKRTLSIKSQLGKGWICVENGLALVPGIDSWTNRGCSTIVTGLPRRVKRMTRRWHGWVGTETLNSRLRDPNT